MFSKIFSYFKKYHRHVYQKLIELYWKSSDADLMYSQRPTQTETPSLVDGLPSEVTQQTITEEKISGLHNFDKKELVKHPYAAEYMSFWESYTQQVYDIPQKTSYLSENKSSNYIEHDLTQLPPLTEPIRHAIGEALTAAVPLPDLTSALTLAQQTLPLGGKPGTPPLQLSELVFVKKVLQERKSLLGALTAWVSTLNNRESMVVPVNDYGQTELDFDENMAADEALIIELMATVKQHITALEQANRLLTNKARPNTAKKLKALTGIEITTEETERQTLAQKLQALKELFEVINHKPFDQMTYIITYDITDNKIRLKVANFLLAMGMRRIQKSVFMGSLPSPTYNRIFETIRAIQASYENYDSVVFLPVASDSLKGMRVVGREVDLDYVLYRNRTVFI